jgi:glycosyltransferase involved in cell wall biosynthesis
VTTWHLLTGEYPPSTGGVGDYTCALALELVRRGGAVQVWSPSIRADANDGGIRLRALPDRFGGRSRRLLLSGWDADPGVVLLQYVPNAVGAGGMNLVFCNWLRRQGTARDVRVMFHEPYFYFSSNPVGNVRAGIQRFMASLLVDASRVVYLSTETWRRFLPAAVPGVVLAVPSTIPRSSSQEIATRMRAQLCASAVTELVGHFGTYGEHIVRELEPIVVLLLERRRSTHFVCIGRNGKRFADAMRTRHASVADRVHYTGTLPPMDVAAAIRACDVMVQPYPDGVTTRRTSMMAALTNGVATVSTAGVLTEPVWHDVEGAALAPASDTRAIATRIAELLDSEPRREALAGAGRRLYDDRFAIERSVDSLLAPA